MSRLIIIIVVFINFLYSQNRIYFIKLGSFKQLPVLERTISRMPENLRSHITVVKSNGWFIAFAYKTTKRLSYLEVKRNFSWPYRNITFYWIGLIIIITFLKQEIF